MLKEIRYTYIAKNKSTDAILTNLTQSLKNFDGCLDGYKVFDNIEHGIRVYPDIVQENVEICCKKDVIDKLENCIEEGIELVLINGFDIDLDEIKDFYAELVDSSDITLCINQLYDVEENVTVSIDPSIYKLDEKEWQELKESIEESMLDVVEEVKNEDFNLLRKIKPSSNSKDNKKDEKKNKDINSANDFSNVLKKIFDIDAEKNNKLDLISPDVIYSQVLKDKELHITKTVSGDIIIDNEIDMITIEKDQLDFFLSTISNLLK